MSDVDDCRAMACAITRARSAIDDAMPRECFPGNNDSRRSDMNRACQVAYDAMRAFDEAMRRGLAAMDEEPRLSLAQHARKRADGRIA